MEDSTLIEASFEGFGYREMAMAAELLEAYSNSPAEFLDQETLKVCLNKNSGYVFLSDGEYNVGMMNDGELQQFFSCPECGHEGFKDDFEDHKDCEGYKSLFPNEEDSDE